MYSRVPAWHPERGELVTLLDPVDTLEPWEPLGI